MKLLEKQLLTEITRLENKLGMDNSIVLKLKDKLVKAKYQKAKDDLWVQSTHVLNSKKIKTRLKLAPKEVFLAVLREASLRSADPYDPISNAMKRHPKLTRETAIKMAEEFGF